MYLLARGLKSKLSKPVNKPHSLDSAYSFRNNYPNTLLIDSIGIV